MYYAKPDGDFFLGDCMPFWHDGIFHLYYLLDEGHRQGLGGLGGHQWAHTTSRDLINWQHHPLALAIDADWEGSICTGSVFFHDGTFHAFYATRKPDWSQHLGHAVSSDGNTFHKTTPNPFAVPPPNYHRNDYRDPFVYQDDQHQFHMLVSSKQLDYALPERGGCLLELTSNDLWEWQVARPLLTPGTHTKGASVPECADLFGWNDWYYLVFGMGLRTHYRIARTQNGPWLHPRIDMLDSQFCAVMKTAPFGDNRRIGVGWAGPRANQDDNGQMRWGGNAVFRELVQLPDGSLGTCFPPELVSHFPTPLTLTITALTAGVTISADSIRLDGQSEFTVVAVDGVTTHNYLRCMITPPSTYGRFGVGIKGDIDFVNTYLLEFDSGVATVMLHNEYLDGVELSQPFILEVVIMDDIIDVCVGGQRCLINRLPALQGQRLFFYSSHGAVQFSDLQAFGYQSPQ